MLANSIGRGVAVIVGLLISCNLAAGQFTPEQNAEADAYRMLNNYLNNSNSPGGMRVASRPVTPTGFDRPIAANQQGLIANPTPTPTPNFGTPNLGVAGGPAGNGTVVGTPGVGGTIPPYTPNPVAAAGPAYAYAAPEFTESGFGGGFIGDEECFEFGPSPLACGAGDCCRGCSRLCVGAEYLYWYTKGMRTPELVTTSPLGVGPGNAGVKGHPDTSVLFGGRRLDSDGTSGVRAHASLALDSCSCNKIDVEYFYLGDNDFDFSKAAPSDYDILARPFYNPWIGGEDAEFVGYPGVVDGRIDISGSTNFQGYGVWWRHNLLCCQGGLGSGGCGGGCGAAWGGGGGGPLSAYGTDCGQRRCTPCRVDLIAGYRHLDLDEELYIRESFTSIDPGGAVPVGTTFDIVDQFETRNDFDGFDFGFNWDYCFGKWGVNALTKVAFGQVRRRATIRGWTHVTEPGNGPQSYDGGLLALPSNIGHYESSDFTVVPEAGINLYYQLGCRLRLNFGYSLVFISDVIRPGDLIDLNVDPRQLPPATVANAINPAYTGRTDDFWAQGFNVGLEFCF